VHSIVNTGHLYFYEGASIRAVVLYLDIFDLPINILLNDMLRFRSTITDREDESIDIVGDG
jgi:hypothetical protein